MRDAGVRSVEITPTAEDFASELGPPIVVDRVGGIAYGLDSTDTVFQLGFESVPKGTSFPVSPATNDLFFRTDRSLIYFYNGTRWLTVNQYPVFPNAYTELFAPAGVGKSATSTTTIAVSTPNWGGFDFWMEEFIWVSNVQTTNNGTSHWRIDLLKFNASGTTAIVQPTTASDTANTWTFHRTAIGALLGTSHFSIMITLTKVVSPGNLFFQPPAVIGRLVG